MEIKDDFLNQEEFHKLQSIIMGEKFTWFYNVGIDYYHEDDKFQFTHVFYDAAAPCSSYCEKLSPIFKKIEPIAIWRIKSNLLTKTPNIIENSFHIDMGNMGGRHDSKLGEEKLKHWTTAIFYLNSNNGYTEFEDGTKVESVANRFVSFPSTLKHRGTSCTDENVRVVINFNYFK